MVRMVMFVLCYYLRNRHCSVPAHASVKSNPEVPFMRHGSHSMPYSFRFLPVMPCAHCDSGLHFSRVLTCCRRAGTVDRGRGGRCGGGGL